MLTPAQQSVIQRVQQLTRETIAPRAAHYDAMATNPVDNWRDLWAEGFLAMAIPQEHGGLGLDMPGYIGAIETLAKGCANTAMTVHMHSTVHRFIDTLGTPEQRTRYFAETVQRGKMFGSWGSEPSVSLSRTFLMETVIRPVSGGYRIDGVKHFCTMQGGASYYMVWCALDGLPNMEKALLQALVPAEAPGMQTDGRWNPMGMRATFSPSVVFDNCVLAADCTLGQPGMATRIGVVESFALGYAAIYLGIAQGALDCATRYCQTKVFHPDNVAIAHEPAIQRHMAEMTIPLEAARLLLYQAARHWEGADVATRGLLANKAKYLATQVGLQVTATAMQVVGGRSALRDLPVERAYRDLRTCTLMPPTVDRMLEVVGKSTLGVEAQMFDFGPASTPDPSI
ncbi:MAG TPA: acyl-CoA dehydrogenase family protein [Candidatus Tectomicrobia bacterium]|nr:acyl-CoA dehydrogenase family protein [Candidatus Tectomicrobia bacterium]